MVERQRTIRKCSVVLSFLLSVQTASAAGSSLPVVLWHGMGDSCCASFSIGAIQGAIEEALPGKCGLPCASPFCLQRGS